MVKQSRTNHTQLGLYAGPNIVFQARADIIEFKGDAQTDAAVFDEYHRIHHDAQIAHITSPKNSNT